MIRRPPRSTRTDTLFPYTTLFRSTHERGVDLLKYMRMLQRDTIVDHRVGCAYNGRVYLPTWFPTDKDYVGDFAVLEVDMPRFNRDIPWEYTTPANGRSYCRSAERRVGNECCRTCRSRW